MKTNNKLKYIELVKKYLYPFITLLLLLITIYEIFFVYTNIQNKFIDENEISAREEKINQSGYNSIIEKNNYKKETDLLSFDQLNNPF